MKIELMAAKKKEFVKAPKKERESYLPLIQLKKTPRGQDAVQTSLSSAIHSQLNVAPPVNYSGTANGFLKCQIRVVNDEPSTREHTTGDHSLSGHQTPQNDRAGLEEPNPQRYKLKLKPRARVSISTMMSSNQGEANMGKNSSSSHYYGDQRAKLASLGCHSFNNKAPNRKIVIKRDQVKFAQSKPSTPVKQDAGCQMMTEHSSDTSSLRDF